MTHDGLASVRRRITPSRRHPIWPARRRASGADRFHAPLPARRAITWRYQGLRSVRISAGRVPGFAVSRWRDSRDIRSSSWSAPWILGTCGGGAAVRGRVEATGYSPASSVTEVTSAEPRVRVCRTKRTLHAPSPHALDRQHDFRPRRSPDRADGDRRRRQCRDVDARGLSDRRRSTTFMSRSTACWPAPISARSSNRWLCARQRSPAWPASPTAPSA